ncbi:MAG: hypothetical protein M3N51_07820, partial [Actinomycetota bacterium]|nr:hypothetical protein [Actinomycetota bacterium]
MRWNRAGRVVSEESGFTILESTVALVIIFGVLLALLRTMDSGIRVLLETRHQAAASAYANELLERARSLEWDNVGLAQTADGSTCPDQVGCYQTEFGLTFDGSNWEFEGNDVVFINPAGTFDPFLSFHVQQTRDETVFDRFFFVTSVPDPADPSKELYRKLTAIVQWTAPSGFGDEVRQVTYVAPFKPPPPFLGG